MAEQKKYLDLNGLKRYDEKIKGYIVGEDNKLAALHAIKVVGEGENAKTVHLTVAEEIAKVVDNAPEAFDTLKEIAQWIAKDGDTGFDAAQRIQNLEGAVSAATLVVEDGQTVTVQNAINKAVSAGVTDVIGTPDEGKTIQDEIDALESTVGTASVKEGDTVTAPATGLTKRVEDIENNLASVITNDDIDDLFDTQEVIEEIEDTEPQTPPNGKDTIENIEG